MKENRDHDLRVRLTKAELEEIKQAYPGFQVSKVVRKLIKDALANEASKVAA